MLKRVQCYGKAVATSGRSSSSLFLLTAALEEMEQTRARAMVLMTSVLVGVFSVSFSLLLSVGSRSLVLLRRRRWRRCVTAAPLASRRWLLCGKRRGCLSLSWCLRAQLEAAGPTGGCCRFWRSSLKKESRPCECLRRDVRASWCCYLRYPVERFLTLPIAFLAVGCSTVEAYSRAK